MTKRVNPDKASVIDHLKDLLAKSKSVAIVDYRGLKVSQATALRQAIKKAGGQYIVAKNTLFKIASGLKDLHLEGISGFIFSNTDEVAAIKAVADFAKKHTIPTFKSGILGDRVLTTAEITQLSSIPDRTVNCQLLTVNLKSPLYNLTYHLKWNISSLVRTLDAVAKSKVVTN